MMPRRSYLLKIGSRTVSAEIAVIHHKLDIKNFKEVETKTLKMNEIGLVTIDLSADIPFDLFAQSKSTLA